MNNFKVLLSLSLGILVNFSTLFAQADNCASATTIVPGATCSTTAYSLPGSLTNGGQVEASCAVGVNNDRDDAWYTFTSGTTGYTSITVSAGAEKICLAVWTNCPAAGAEVTCVIVPAGSTQTINFPTSNSTPYYVQLHRRTGNGTASTSGNICIVNAPPPPSNDNPCAATAVTVNSGTTCVSQAPGTLINATASGTALGACFGTADDDVWYSFVATSTSQIVTLNNITGSTTDMYFSVHPGTCGAIGAALLCSDPNTGTVTGLTVGTTYFIRVYSWTSTPNQTSSFLVCVTTPPPPPSPPSNDNPCSATTLTVNPNYLCGVQTPGTINGATATGTTLGTCFGTADDDVWYSFVATGSTHNVSLNNITGSTTDMYFSVHSGSCASPGAAILCSDPNSSVVTGLTAGNTYYVRVYSWTSTTGQTSSFDICIGTPPPPPSNDNPCSATTVPVNPDFLCASQIAGTIASATPTGTALGSCFGTADDDVWYQFTATGPSHQISLNNITGSTSDMYFSVHPGTCAAPGAALLCSDPESGMVTGLTAGTTYWIRVYSYTSTAGQTSSFSVCIGTPPPPPANDDCANAVNLNPTTNCSGSVLGTIASATPSVQPNNCFGTADDDVWYRFTATNTSMNISLTGITGSTTDMYHSVFNGTCASLGTAIICNDNNASNLTGLTVGNVYYVRVYSYTSTAGQTSSFDICAQIPPPPPTNLTCSQMQPICSGLPISFTAQATGSAAEAGNNYSCLSTRPNPTWFYLEIDQPGVLNIDISAGSDVDFALWGPYTNLANAQATCGSHGAPIDCSYSSSPTEQANISNALVGQVYVLLVTNYANTIQSINLKDAFGNTASTNCAIVPLPSGFVSFEANYMYDKVYIDWITSTELNTAYFEVQRSTDGIIWQTIGMKQAAGNSTKEINYRIVDEKTFENIVYYRIKQVDLDGEFTFTPTRSVVKETKSTSAIFPSPADNEFNVISKEEIKSLIAIDAQGRQYTLSFSKTGASYRVDCSNLAAGLYQIQILSNNQMETLKLVIK
jgi:hypothetical protein